MDLAGLDDLAAQQAGVLARRQVLALGGTDNDIRRLVRRREWAAVHPGVYVTHTGPLPWVSRAWAAVLFHWPAALAHRSALDLVGEPVHVAVGRDRNRVALPGVQLHRMVDLERRVRWNLGPPRLRVEDAVLQVCANASSPADAFATVTEACRQRRTTPARLLTALDALGRLRHGSALRVWLEDVSSGVHSVLEHRYVTDVERAHGLPCGVRQQRDVVGRGTVYRDVVYEGLGVVVELDGRVGHETTAERDCDRRRDLEAAATGWTTLRLGWGQVDRDPCSTAALVAEVLRARGWTGRLRPCGRGECSRGGLRAPSA